MIRRLAVALAVSAILIGDAFAGHSGFPAWIAAGPLPRPVLADGRSHLVYELHLTNVAPIPIELLTLEVAGDDESHPLASYHDTALQKLIAPAENLLTSVDADRASKTRTIAEGKSAVIFLDVTLEPGTQPPAALHHRFSFAIRGNPDLDRTINGPTVEVVRDALPVLHPPLRGPGWVAFNALSAVDHRRAVQVIDGKLSIAQRFAIDWMELGPDGRLFHDDSKSNANFYGYGAEVLAVAAGRVADLRDDMPENKGNNERGSRHVTVDSVVGNYVTLDLGSGHFALYAHLQPGTIKVKVGDQVKPGQVLAALGNSGNSDAPHLHFHLMDANSPLGSEGLPYELARFTQMGSLDGAEAALDSGQSWQPKPGGGAVSHDREFPVNSAVVAFTE